MNAEIELRKMTESEFAAYIKISLPEYAAEKKKGENLTDEQAMKVAKDAYDRFLPDGLASPDQFLYSAVAAEKIIGSVWLGRKHEPRPHVWIYDIVINPSQRGQGYGRKLMNLIDEEVRKMGISSIGLHVFGHNTVAQSLYEKTGFRTTNRIMVKDL